MFNGKSNYQTSSSNLATLKKDAVVDQIYQMKRERNLEKWPYDVIMSQSDVIYSTTQHYIDTSNLSPITC